MMKTPPPDAVAWCTLDGGYWITDSESARIAAQDDVRTIRWVSGVVTSAIRESIIARELTTRQIARDTGIGVASIYEFIYGGKKLHSDNVDTLCEYLGIRVIPSRKR